VKKDKGDDLATLKEAQLPLDIDADQYYNDLEVDDFNKLFRNDQLIGDKFGKSIKVNLELANPQVKRRVVEHVEMVRHGVNENSPS
jgi:replication fork clamp-binding protein CrfC